ncbi:pyridoxal phosphate-dependent aminotransferase [Caldivirga sp. UBA161]|uniref:pyridoxal phosphate-dependent aminotransferase n=1 Tax=Caldivirga sp. UBA161 TaxID=1915569 RepID=UPI0025C26BCB|nr:pyridoxal phosphate-dependent aminotransferase [Caldivirga sp. UBA161]
MPKPAKGSEYLRGSMIREVNTLVDELEGSGIDVIKMHIGQPGVPPSSRLISDFTNLLKEKPFELSAYSSTPGILELREAIADDYHKYSGVKVSPSNISVTTGSSEAIITLAMAFLNPGDKVVVLNPTYLLYKPIMQYFNAKVTEVKVSISNNFNPDPEELKEVIDKDTKLIVLVNPDNPTGSTLRDEVVKTAVDLAVDNDSLLIYDEAYRHLYYEGEHVYALRYNMSNVIALNTFSKDPALPGWRLGFVVTDESILNVFNRVKQYVNINPPTPAQYIGLLYLRKYKENFIKEIIPLFRERRDVVYSSIKSMLPDAKVLKPSAGLFIFPDLSSYLSRIKMSDLDFSLRLLREKHVGVVPGSAFGDGGALHIRINFTRESTDRLREGVEKIAELLRELSAL